MPNPMVSLALTSLW